MGVSTTQGDSKLLAYRRGEQPLPVEYWLWPLYGRGLENLGQDDGPILVDRPRCGPDQLLVRHDAVGLCFSDIKVIKAGEAHPRLNGRDMRTHPVVLGHEVALTVMQVGDTLARRYQRGDRFIVQADIYYQGVGLAYGYALQGGLSQYNLIGQEILEGDDGCYLLPLKPETGYAQAALTEPWACVLASYSVNYRTSWKEGGAVLIASGPGAQGGYRLGAPYLPGQAPAQMVVMGVKGALRDELRRRASSDGIALREVDSLDALGGSEFDDIVLLGADAALYERLEPLANKGCSIALVGARALSDPAQVDVGRLHYDSVRLAGTPSQTVADAYAPIRAALMPGGSAAFLGAGGPMGQMHVQRALQAQGGPRLVVATDLVAERLGVLERRFVRLLEPRDGARRLVLRAPDGLAPEAFNAELVQETDGAGFSDVVVLAPSAKVVSGAVGMLAPHGVMNIFAGLPRGTRASIDLSRVVNEGIRFTGTSGSSIDDLRTMLGQAESGRLDPNLSVVAIAGLRDAKKGLEGLIAQRFPGKVVIYPQLLDFPLTWLKDLQAVLPGVYARLGPSEAWTVEAEAELLRELLS